MADEQDIATRYDVYKHEVVDDIRSTIERLGCQPILFVGSGIPRRYIGAPSWDELLQQLAEACPTIDKGLGYYKQSLVNAPDIGEKFAALYQEWAWSGGKNSFPAEMFTPNTSAQSYIKYEIARRIKEITPRDIGAMKAAGHADEIESLQAIKPHAIITTNYDTVLEAIFPDLLPIVGQSILSGSVFTIGELFKIHGSVEDYESLVFTRADYDEFISKKKYLSAKMLTFFSEHPLLFVGYSASDPNIQGILSDIDEALSTRGGVIPNVYILEYDGAITPASNPPREKVIQTGENKSVRVKLIVTDDFGWVFDAFAANPALSDVSPKVLRALLARSYNLVRHDIPRMTVEADFQMLNGAVESNETFAKLFGLAEVSDYSTLAASHPFALTEVGKALGGKGWHLADKLLKRIKVEKGVDLKESDNKYHVAHKVNKTVFGKYSQDAVDLLNRVQRGEDYHLD